jgi:allantoin racemase
MEIRYIVPGQMSAAEVHRREHLLQTWSPPDVTVSLVRASPSPASMESLYEENLWVPALAEALLDAETQGIDAIIVGCFDDPGVDALREIATRTVVIGPGNASMHLAAQVGDSFGVVTAPTVGSLRRFVQAQGMRNWLVDIAVVDTPVLELGHDVKATISHIESGAGILIQKGASAIVLGCMSMAFLDIDHELTQRFDVPFVNPAKAAIGAAVTIVRAGLAPSKAAYPFPPKLKAGKRLVELIGE